MARETSEAAVNTPIDGFRQSHSSMMLAMTCEQKYFFSKVLRRPIDSDAEEDTHALRFGSALHQIAENTMHEMTSTVLSKEVTKAVADFGLDPEEDAHKLAACAVAYRELHKGAAARCVICELELVDGKTIGYIDAVLVDAANRFWIMDLKTSSRVQENLLWGRLSGDPQLNAYAHFQKEVYDALVAKGESPALTFGGVVYRVVQKPSNVIRAGETPGEYARRLFEDPKCACKAFACIIPAHELQIPETRERFLQMHQRIMDLREGRAKPIANMSNCMAYMRPCEYWSGCYKRTFSECVGEALVTNSRSKPIVMSKVKVLSTASLTTPAQDTQENEMEIV